MCTATGKPLYLISDPVHLYKKLRNQLLASFVDGDSRAKRSMMWNGHDVTWNHVIALFEEECARPVAQSPYRVRAVDGWILARHARSPADRDCAPTLTRTPAPAPPASK